AADDHRDVGATARAQLGDHGTGELEVTAREHRQPDHIDIFLNRHLRDRRRLEADAGVDHLEAGIARGHRDHFRTIAVAVEPGFTDEQLRDRKSTRLNSSHSQISYAVFCLKKKNNSYTF